MPNTLRVFVRDTFATVILFVSAISLHAQTPQSPPWKSEIAKGYLPYHRLVAEDFPIKDDGHPENKMYTLGFLHHFYSDEVIVKDDRATARVTKWVCWSGFDRNKSWRKRGYTLVNETLPHEQGHLDIHELYCQRFARTPLEELPFGTGSTADGANSDLIKKIQAMADRLGEELNKEQRRYDAATNYGQNTVRQREWTASIQKRLRAAGIHF